MEDFESMENFYELQRKMEAAEAGKAPAVSTMLDSVPPRKFIDISRSPEVLCLDARAPVEYNKGHVIGARNVPLLSNEERAKVGTTFAKSGRKAAINLGFNILKPKAKHLAAEVTKLLEDAKATTLVVYCARGGLRSNSLGWFIQRELEGRQPENDTSSTMHFELFVAEGGYKAYKKIMRESFLSPKPEIIIVGGRTGSGKTKLLHQLRDTLGQQVIDLEGDAQHSGSTFGRVGFKNDQPSSEHYANILGTQWLYLDPEHPVFIEDEGPNVGHTTVPLELYKKMRGAPTIVKLEVPESLRIANLVCDYVPSADADDQRKAQWFEYMSRQTNKLKKRLGGDRLKQALEALEAGEYGRVAQILLAYYDKMYDHHFAQGREAPNIIPLRYEREVAGEEPFIAESLNTIYKELAKQLAEKLDCQFV